MPPNSGDLEVNGIPHAPLPTTGENQPLKNQRENDIDNNDRNSDSAQRRISLRDGMRRLESVFEIAFGSCTGGLRIVASQFARCRGVDPEPSNINNTPLVSVKKPSHENLWHQTNHVSARRHTVDIPPFLAPKGNGNDGFELGSFHCDDTISAISACTLDEMARAHHRSPGHCSRDQPSPARVDPQKKQHSTLLLSHRSKGIPPLAASPSGSSSASAYKNHKISKNRNPANETNRKVAAYSRSFIERNKDETTMKIIEQHDMLMSELSADLHGAT